MNGYSAFVSRIVAEYGLSSDTILKFHKGNKQYKTPADSQMQFDILDKSISKIRIVLLVQIGKEGWDCRSLTGIILSQEGDCPKNMVLQTACRCLRQVQKDALETALIYLNSSNAEKLNAQLLKQHHISLKEFCEADHHKVSLARYDRTDHLHLPKVDFYQLKIHYETLIVDPSEPEKTLPDVCKNASIVAGTIKTTDFSMEVTDTRVDNEEHGAVPASYSPWLYNIVRSSLYTLTMEELQPYDAQLRSIFEEITYQRDGSRYFSSKYHLLQVEANIRKTFCALRSYATQEERIPQSASLLNIANFTQTVETEWPQDYYPDQETVQKIVLDDQGKLKLDKKAQAMMELAQEMGQEDVLTMLRKKYSSHPQKDRSFHYLPYHTDSGFEQVFLREVLTFPAELGSWIRAIHPDDHEKAVALPMKVAASPDAGDAFVCTYRMRHADGSWLWILGRGCVSGRDSAGRALRVVGMHTDVTALQEERDALEGKVQTDPLTGVSSRYHLERVLQHADGQGRPLYAVMADVDGLKLVNDHLGHEAGDTLLCRAAHLLQAHIRKEDCLARIGGDEFVILFFCPGAVVRKRLAAIRQALLHRRQDSGLPVELSFGVAGSDKGGMDAEELLRRADVAMLRAKKRRRAASHARIRAWLERHTGREVASGDPRL